MAKQMQMLPGPDAVRLKKVWYEGSDTLLNGYALCRNADYSTAATAYPSRGVRAEQPSSGNLHNFLGLVQLERGAAGITGPCEVPVAEPTRGGVMVVGYAAETCVLDTTLLTVQPGSYVLGGVGEGLPIGIAAQTVDRGTDNGTVLMLMTGPSCNGIMAGTGGSRTIWETCPWYEMQMDPRIGAQFFDDYLRNINLTTTGGTTGTSTTEIREWIQTEVTSGLTTMVDTSPGGILRVSSEAYAGADHGITVMYRDTGWTPTDGKRIWFEARVRMTDIDTTPDQFFVGLANTITSAHPSGVVDDTVDKIGFYTHSGTTAATMSFITAKTTVQQETASAATELVDATWVNLGFVADLATITPYVDGVAGTAHTTSASMPTAATGLGILYAAHVDQTSAVANLDIDWVKVAQLK